MAKDNKPNDQELWLELVQIKQTPKGAYDEKRIDDIIDRYVDKGLVFKDKPGEGLNKAVSLLRKRKRKAQALKKVLLFVLVLLGVGLLAWGWHQYYVIPRQKEAMIEIQRTQTSEFMANFQTKVAGTIIRQHTSTAWALQNPTQVDTPNPTSTEAPTPTATSIPAPVSSVIAGGSCDSSGCQWNSVSDIEVGSYALYLVKDFMENNIITDHIGEISIMIPGNESSLLQSNLRECSNIEQGGRCFLGLIDLNQPQRSFGGSSEGFVSDHQLAINLEFIKISPEGVLPEMVTDVLIPSYEFADLPMCQEGNYSVIGVYRPTRNSEQETVLQISPPQPVEGQHLYYLPPPQAEESMAYCKLLMSRADGWIMDEAISNGGYFVVVSKEPFPESVFLLATNPYSPDTPQE
ncbi:MAG: hypothetical protein PHS86_10700 [Syntrophaceae bacterium]|nr:hypothetical protein [Syntrophaceae bacterium]